MTFQAEISGTHLNLSGEIDDAAEQMKIAVQVLKDFKNLFFEYTEKLPSYFKGDQKPVLWEFRPGLIFRSDWPPQKVDHKLWSLINNGG